MSCSPRQEVNTQFCAFFLWLKSHAFYYPIFLRKFHGLNSDPKSHVRAILVKALCPLSALLYLFLLMSSLDIWNLRGSLVHTLSR
jgi:hypothetical protein